jgi:hypothetical protein
MDRTVERPAFRINGFTMLFIILPAIAILAIYAATNIVRQPIDLVEPGVSPDVSVGAIVLVIVAGLFLLIALGGFTVLQPNEGQVLVFFGRYVGTVNAPGFHWVNPFAKPQSKRVSLRMNNFDSAKVKVNDKNGNPVEIAAVVVWRVIDTATAVFDVQNYHEYVRVQSETAVRHLATTYPYDSQDPETLSLSGTVDEVSAALQSELADRLRTAGVEVIEARLSHLAYAPEIAAVMLRRQQASAVVAARGQMVAGAVGMVELALKELDRGGMVQLDPLQKARLVSNLLVVLTSEQTATPIVSAEG